MKGALMVCGTTSDAGKTTLVTGLCRLLARRGIAVAPFKAQNMALNSAVTASGAEIGRAQVAQAQAARVEPEAAMNPILLKPTSERTSQVIVDGHPWAVLDAAEYHRRKPELLDLVLDRLADLRSRYDVVICEGAGSPAEINLLDADIVNLRVAQRAAMSSIVVGDIDRGGVFAALYGTVALLPDDLRATVGGFVINKLRGDPGLLGDGPAQLERRCGIATLGVLPFLRDIGIDAEDSLALPAPNDPRRLVVAPGSPALIDVAAIRFPRVSNFTDLDPLVAEPAVSVRWVDHPRALGRPDLVVLPGSKATVSDLDWFRRSGLADAVVALADDRGATTILGICGGYQMLGRTIDDPIEAGLYDTVIGLGLLPVSTRFGADKVLRQRRGWGWAKVIDGYQIHHGRTTLDGGGPWLELDGEPEGASRGDGRVLGTSLHGLLESDGFRAELLSRVAARAGIEWRTSGVSFRALREDRFDRLADALEEHLDMAAIEKLIGAGS